MPKILFLIINNLKIAYLPEPADNVLLCVKNTLSRAKKIIMLVAGGDKSTQRKDIQRAQDIAHQWED